MDVSLISGLAAPSSSRRSVAPLAAFWIFEFDHLGELGSWGFS
jgi:hypothetical protein